MHMQVHNNFNAKEIELKIKKPQSIASYYYGTLQNYANMVSSHHLPQKDCKENYPWAKLQISGIKVVRTI